MKQDTPFMLRLRNTISVDLPGPDDVFWKAIAKTLKESKATEIEANAALDRIAKKPIQFSDQLQKRLVEEIQAVRVERRIAVQAESRECRDCGGSGLASRHRHNAKPHEPAVLTFFCLCSMGREMLAVHRKADTQPQILDLEHYPYLHLKPQAWSNGDPDNRYRYRPSEWDESLGQPKIPPTRTRSVKNPQPEPATDGRA